MRAAPSRRFPIGLTLASAIAFIVMIGLGVWQVQRFQWKEQTLARIEALSHAPPQPIGPVLARAARGETVDFTRVVADCAPAPAAPAAFSMSARDGDYVWRALSPCRSAASAWQVRIDRGLFDAARGQTAAPAVSLPAPGVVTGVLRKTGPAAYVLVAERETPPVPGVTPSPWESQAPDNLQYVGEYAPTWFGLAGVLCAFYGAMLWRRYRAPR